MADIDNFNRTWQRLTHGEVEDAIKAKAAAMEEAIGNAGVPEGGIPKEHLSQAVQSSLNKADTALQSVSYSDLKDAPEYAVAMGRFDRGSFYPVTLIVPGSGPNHYSSEPLENPPTGVIYIDLQHGSFYRYDSETWVPLGKIPIDTGVVPGSTNAVQGGAIYNALEGKQDKIDDIEDFVGSAIHNLVGEVAPIDGSGRVPYNKIPKIALESMNHIHSDSSGNTQFIGNAYFCPGENKLRYYYAANKSVSYDPDKGCVYYDKETKHFYIWDGSRMQRIGINIAVVGPNDSVPEGVDLCFFIADTSGGGGGGTVPDDPDDPGGGDPVNPDPGVHTVSGDNFNALLAGNDSTAAFSPGKLYALSGAVNDINNDAPEYSYEDAEIDLEDEDAPIAVDDNEVFFNHDDGESVDAVRTPMRYYGDIVASNTVKMADTADTAYISFMVAHPFFADETDVAITFNMNDVQVGYKRIGIDHSWIGIASGSAIAFANTDDAMEVLLMVRRINSGFTTTGMKSTITLNNGHEDTAIDVIFNPAKVLYKNGEVGNGFSIQAANQIPIAVPLEDGHGVSRLAFDDVEYCLVASNTGRYCPLIQGVQLDMSKFNVLYAVLSKRGSTWTELMAYDGSWGGAWVDDGEGNLTPRHKCTGKPDYDRCYYNAYQISSTLADTILHKDEFDSWKERVGYGVLNCFVHNERPANPGNKAFDLYLAKDNGELHILEIGIITYDTSLI